MRQRPAWCPHARIWRGQHLSSLFGFLRVRGTFRHRLRPVWLTIHRHVSSYLPSYLHSHAGHCFYSPRAKLDRFPESNDHNRCYAQVRSIQTQSTADQHLALPAPNSGHSTPGCTRLSSLPQACPARLRGTQVKAAVSEMIFVLPCLKGVPVKL